MGYIASATAVYATAYLTEKGRNYLFNSNNIRFDSSGNDLFAITSFTLGDPDTNYNVTQILQEGDVPDVSGNSDQCLKTAADATQTTLLYFTVNALSFVTPIYDTSLKSNGEVLTINTDTTSNFPVNSATDIPPTIIIVSGPPSGPPLSTF